MSKSGFISQSNYARGPKLLNVCISESLCPHESLVDKL